MTSINLTKEVSNLVREKKTYLIFYWLATKEWDIIGFISLLWEEEGRKHIKDRWWNQLTNEKQNKKKNKSE